jgi:hypothetical protein
MSEEIETTDDLATWITRELKDSKKHSAEWRKNSKECYDFYATKQWSDEDKAVLDASGRPAVVFNRTARTVNAICGLEIQNRQEVRYIPRELNDTGVNELLTEAAKWVRQNCDAEDEESESFQDLVICGMGWTDTNLDYEEEKDGKILVDRFDPGEAFWDPSAKKKNIVDSRWRARVKKVSDKEIQELWPEYEPAQASESWLDNDEGEHDASPPFYEHGKQKSEQKKDRELVHFQWFEKERFYRVETTNGNVIELSELKYERLKPQIESMGLKVVPQRKRVYKCAYLCGKTVLETRDLETQTGFTFQCMTGARDRNANTWFGLVALMMDPQRWANKWLSQVMHILNSNSKGGLLAEQDAFANIRKAEDEWSKPDAITWMNPGGLNKVKEKTMAQFPVGIDKLLQYAVESINDVPGVNSELLGLAERDQPGVLEGMRKQAGVTMLAVFFDAGRRYRKDQGRILAEMIREYISDGRLIRIVGDGRGKYVPLLKDQITFEYDVIVDEAPTSPNMKNQVFAALNQMLPALMKSGIPLPPELLDYTPLPESLVQKWKEHIQAAQKRPNPEVQAKEREFAMKEQEQQQKMAFEQQKLEMERQKQIEEAQLERWKAEQEVNLHREQMYEEMRLSEAKREDEFRLGQEKHAQEGQAQADRSANEVQTFAPMLADAFAQITERQSQAFAQMIERQDMKMGELAQLMSADREVVRDKSGRPTGSRMVRH